MYFFYRDLKRRKELHDAEGRVDCQLFEGYPIFIVEDWPVLRKVMKALEDEELIGIDTEWKPHFVSTKEQLSEGFLCLKILENRKIFWLL